MTVTEPEVIPSDTEESDIIHVVCKYCSENIALCGSVVEGKEWAPEESPPEDECIVCVHLEEKHVCKDRWT